MLSTANSFQNILFCFLFVIYTGTFIACNSKQHDQKIEDSSTYTNLRIGYLEKTVRDISQYSTVDAAAVGFGGVQSEQYERFLVIRKIATDHELIRLAASANANVKAYAFMALADRNYPDCRLLLQQHLKDSASFQYRSGCIGSTQSINSFYLSCLSGKLTAAEIASYKTQISK